MNQLAKAPSVPGKSAKSKGLKPATKRRKPKPNELQIAQEPGKSKEQQFADLAVRGVGGNAATVRLFAAPWMGELGLTESIGALKSELAAVKAGDMASVEEMLFGQAKALEAVFHACLNRAATNLGQYPDAVDRYMRLGMKAQSQCRTTLEALAEVKNPRAVAFVRQANIANGHQQVINEARAGEVDNRPNELLEATHVTRLDAGAAR